MTDIVAGIDLGSTSVQVGTFDPDEMLFHTPEQPICCKYSIRSRLIVGSSKNKPINHQNIFELCRIW